MTTVANTAPEFIPSARLPSSADRHILSRFSYGVTPALMRTADNLGGARAWFESQLSPEDINDLKADALRSWYPTLDRSPEDLWRDVKAGKYLHFDISMDLARWTALRRIYSRRQLYERMTDFWSNVLHVASPDDKAWPQRSRYDAMIRRHALGRFEDMLYAAITHPAMGCYLDNAVSRKDNVNENLGRELLELHTVGVGTGYSEAMVSDSARILTGWKVDRYSTWQQFYSPEDHYTGPVRVLTFSNANSSPDGRSLTRSYLRYLANHPATAAHIARRLCLRFVSDAPSESLVADVARAFRTSGTDIKATLRALVRHPEFLEAVDAKVRTPSEDTIATFRLLSVKVQEPVDKDDAGNLISAQLLRSGQRPFDWPTPDGFPETADAWASVGRMLSSWQMHASMAQGKWAAGAGVKFRAPAAWLPSLPATFGEIVEHIASRLLARPANVVILRAAEELTGVSGTVVVRSVEDIAPIKIAHILTAVLNSRPHLRR